MRMPSVVVLVTILCLAGCSQSANLPAAATAPLAPTAVLASPGDVEVPFHSDVVWTKVDGSEVGLCTVPLPEGKVYLMRRGRDRSDFPAIAPWSRTCTPWQHAETSVAVRRRVRRPAACFVTRQGVESM